ncbi:MAG TPA: SPW repeat protein [Mycobacterium sp.]|nr:SPW repeat protein [Mycobacterium sp.]
MHAPQSVTEYPETEPTRDRYECARAAPAAQIAFGMMLVTGLYTALAPWLVGFSAERLIAVNSIIGLSVAVLAFSFACALERTHGLAWTVPVLGFWLAGSAWALYDVSVKTQVAWSNVIAGGMIVVLGVVAPTIVLRALRRQS